MKPIVVESNYGYSDTLDGKRLAQGERIRIQWPDLSRSEHTVSIEVIRHNDRESTVTSFGSVFAVHRGAQVQLYLRDCLGILAERVM